uniref:helix-turn-helix domain-containing protein n=1 Tax=uncultured Sphingomonas sp. TaxID=158754 RepID=UPI0035C9620E
MRYSLQFKELRKRAGYTQASLAEAMGVEQPTIQRWEAGSRTPDVSQLIRLSGVLGVEPGELFEGSSILALGPRLYVKGEVAAGVWKDAWEMEPATWETFTGRADIRAPSEKRFGLRVVGDSMDLLYPHGSVVECVLLDGPDSLESGRRVVVERRNISQESETTVKEFYIDKDGIQWLLPRSSNPAFQSPIRLGVDDPDIDTVSVIALVVGSYRAE